MSSLVETKALKLARVQSQLLAQYNKRQIVRTYPAGIRVDSRYIWVLFGLRVPDLPSHCVWPVFSLEIDEFSEVILEFASEPADFLCTLFMVASCRPV